jgi:bacteriocin biosynthesis cyclodehydratase domain-containing protein
MTDMPSCSIAVVPVGSFGRAVAKYLALICPGTTEIVAPGSGCSIDQMPVGGCGVLAVAAWRPVPSMVKSLCQLSQAARWPFIPLIVESSSLRLGPVIVPGISGCWDCWLLRAKQHAPSDKEQSALWSYYETHPEIGPRGFLESFAMLGASEIISASRRCEGSAEAAGYIWEMNTFTRDVSTGRLVGVDDCPHCGLQRDLRERTFVELRQSLAFLWKSDIRTADEAAGSSAYSVNSDARLTY